MRDLQEIIQRHQDHKRALANREKDSMTNPRTTGDPTTVHVDAVDTALQLLGIYDLSSIAHVLIEPRRITVKRRRHDESGNYIPAGDEVATTTTVIAIT